MQAAALPLQTTHQRLPHHTTRAHGTLRGGRTRRTELGGVRGVRGAGGAGSGSPSGGPACPAAPEGASHTGDSAIQVQEQSLKDRAGHGFKSSQERFLAKSNTRPRAGAPRHDEQTVRWLAATGASRIPPLPLHKRNMRAFQTLAPRDGVLKQTGKQGEQGARDTCSCNSCTDVTGTTTRPACAPHSPKSLGKMSQK